MVSRTLRKIFWEQPTATACVRRNEVGGTRVVVIVGNSQLQLRVRDGMRRGARASL
jgi:serine phosphatase RsbU (regulator of sigma subunit)